MKYCHKCRTSWEGCSQPGPKATCQKCGEDLHVCVNCRFYDTGKPNQCMENVQEPVINKERGNFCDEFQFADRTGESGPAKGSSETDRAREQWKKIFGA